MKIDFPAFLDSLRYMGIGLVGIFCVMAVIIAAIVLLGKFSSRAAKKG